MTRFEFGVVFVLAGAFVLALAMAVRRLRRSRTWNALALGLETNYPNSELLVDLEAFEVLSVVNGPKLGFARSIASPDGIFLLKTGTYFTYRPFCIPWSEISAIDFTGNVRPSLHGNDYSGLARITTRGGRHIALDVPWRGLFDRHVPSNIKLVSTQVVKSAN